MHPKNRFTWCSHPRYLSFANFLHNVYLTIFHLCQKCLNYFKPTTFPATSSTSSTATGAPLEDRKPIVYISHSGDDKQTMAIPLREKLAKRGYSPFVDEVDIPCGEDSVQFMNDEMENADIFVFILSPKFLVSKWPVKEMMFAFERRKRCLEEDRHPPAMIPVFYSISPREMENNITSMYAILRENSSHDEAMPEEEEYREAVMMVRRCMGVMNHFDADNGSHTSSRKKRDALLTELCKHISKVCQGGCEGDSNSHSDYPPHGSM